MDRQTAKSLNMIHYNTGRPCINGHLSDRYVSTGNCVKCINDASKNYRATNKKQKIAAIVGDVIIENRVNMRDVDTLRAFVDALNQRRRVIYDIDLRAAAARLNGAPESHSPHPKAIDFEPFLPKAIHSVCGAEPFLPKAISVDMCAPVQGYDPFDPDAP